MKLKKIAIFCNFLDTVGGAERVGLTLAKELNADIYTTNIDYEKIKAQGFSDVRVKSIGKIPVNAPFRQQMILWRFHNLNLKNKYDFYIIEGDWAMAGAVNNHPNLWYCHTPTREIWNLYKYVRKNMVPFFLRKVFDLWVKYNRDLNKKHIKNVDKIVCNSINTQKRIKKYLNRKAKVIYPPIETLKFHCRKNKSYWLNVSRLTPPKRIEMQMKAFAKLPDEKLVIAGSYEKSRHFLGYVDYIKKIKPKNVILLAGENFEKIKELYANCRGFITTAYDEDFGMTPVEAMASGKPVIAPNEGGYRETVINRKTGVLINNIDEDKLAQAIKKMSQELKRNPQKYKKACMERAKKFDVKIFIRKIKKEIG